MFRGFRAALVLLGGAFALQAQGLGLGEPLLHSAPGEPLDLTIPVLCEAGECEHFDAALGGSADYRAAGVPEPRLHGQLGIGYDRALDAIRVRSTEPLPPQNLHLLFDLRTGSISLRKDVVVAVQAAPQEVPAAAPAAAATPVSAAEPAPSTAPAVAQTVPAPAASTPAAKPAATPAPARAEQTRDPGAQAAGLLKSLEPSQIAMGVGIGVGLLLAYLAFRFLRAVYRETIGRWIGGIRYRLSARKRERKHQIAAAQLAPGAPLPERPRAGPAQAGGAAKTPALRDVKDEVARRLRAQIEAEPERLDLKLKLAERLFALQDGEAYTELVLALKPLLKETAWERLRKMGQQLRPYDDRFLNLGDRGVADTVPLIKSNY